MTKSKPLHLIVIQSIFLLCFSILCQETSSQSRLVRTSMTRCLSSKCSKHLKDQSSRHVKLTFRPELPSAGSRFSRPTALKSSTRSEQLASLTTRRTSVPFRDRSQRTAKHFAITLDPTFEIARQERGNRRSVTSLISYQFSSRTPKCSQRSTSSMSWLISSLLASRRPNMQVK